MTVMTAKQTPGWKKFFGWGLQIFCEWCQKWSSFWVILAHVTWPRAQLLGQSISLKFSLETRIESVSSVPFENKLPLFSTKLPFHEIFLFRICSLSTVSTLPNFLHTQATSWNKWKHSCNVHCLKNYPGTIMLLVCHTITNPMWISPVFE